MKTKESNSFEQKIIPKIYDPSYKLKSDLWLLKWIALSFIIIDFHWLNKHPLSNIDVSNIDVVTSSVFLYVVYALLFSIFYRNKLSFKIQIFNLISDFLIITFFMYLSLSMFAYGSRIYMLYLISIIYCSYWFKRVFTIIFVTLISFTYFITNYCILLANMENFYIFSEIKGTLMPVAAVYYIVAIGVILLKRRIQKYFIKKLHDVGGTFTKISEFHIDIDKALKKIADTAAEVLETDLLLLYRYNEKHNEIIWPPIYTGDINYPELIISEQASSETAISIIKRGISHYSDHSQEDPILTSRAKRDRKHPPDCFVIREDIVSAAGILLKVSQKIVGIMFIHYRTPHEFDTEERKKIEIIASYIALAIQDVIHFNEKQIAHTMQTIGKVASNFAHKIKNDIGAIQLYTVTLLGKTKPEMPHYFPLTQIKERISKIKDDIDSLLSTSKSKDKSKKIIDIKNLVNELKSEVLPDLKTKKIKFDIEITPDLPKIECDPIQIKMVFVNLAQNSIDAMPEGGRISLSISKSKKNLLLKWTDSGGGISLNDAQKIFDIFWTTKGNGSGLGLFHVKAIIEEHGGSISLDLDYKKGARFIIKLPTKLSKSN